MDKVDMYEQVLTASASLEMSADEYAEEIEQIRSFIERQTVALEVFLAVQ